MGLRTTFQNVVTTPVPSDIDANAIITLLHDHSFLITMQPIVTRHEIRDRNAETGAVTYTVYENIDVLPFGLWKREISFTTAFIDKREGVSTWVDAAMGVHSEAEYTIKPGEQWDGEGRGWVLDEQIETSCNFLLRWFVETTMVPVRKKMHEQIIDAVREREKNVRESRESDGAPAGNYI